MIIKKLIICICLFMLCIRFFILSFYLFKIQSNCGFSLYFYILFSCKSFYCLLDIHKHYFLKKKTNFNASYCAFLMWYLMKIITFYSFISEFDSLLKQNNQIFLNNVCLVDFTIYPLIYTYIQIKCIIKIIYPKFNKVRLYIFVRFYTLTLLFIFNRINIQLLYNMMSFLFLMLVVVIFCLIIIQVYKQNAHLFINEIFIIICVLTIITFIFMYIWFVYYLFFYSSVSKY